MPAAPRCWNVFRNPCPETKKKKIFLSIRLPLGVFSLNMKSIYWGALLLLYGLRPLVAAPADAAPAHIALVSDTHTTRGTNDDQPLYRGGEYCKS